MSIKDASGAVAFMRAVKNQLSLKTTFGHGVETISEFASGCNIASEIVTDFFDQTSDKNITLEHGTQICKAVACPALVFLHMDQGCYEDTGYTPFASVKGNSRSIDPIHVKDISEKVAASEGEITQEDISIVPFQVCLDGQNDQPEANQPEPISYRCSLNRDRHSNITLMGKKALPISKQALEALNRMVSF